nr:isoform 2 of protein ae7 [Quercus suber]
MQPIRRLIRPPPQLATTVTSRYRIDTATVEVAILESWIGFVSFFEAHSCGDIKDPEHPYSLEELKEITEDAIEVDDQQSYVRITFTPTVEHCSMATIIGVCLRVKLLRSLPSRYKVDIRVVPGSHASESAVNKQLNDKERVAAALENPNLVDMVDECLAPSYD